MISNRPAFWICCHFPQLPLETLRAGLPEEQPFALIDAGRGDSRAHSKQQQVLAANALAEALGVRAGMSLATAYSYCPQLRCHARQQDAEARRLRQLAETAYGFTPHVSLLPPNALLLECAGSLRLFAGPERLLQALESAWRALDHYCELGIADTPLAATVLARARLRLSPQSTQGLALGVRVRRALTQVHLRHLAEAALVEQFAASGITTLGAVLALPRAAVGRRFGKSLLDDLARLLGERPDPRDWIRPQPDFRARVQLLEPLRQRAGLVFPMHRLLRDLTMWLRARQLLADRIEWRFGTASRSPGPLGTAQREGNELCLEVRLAAPGADERRLLALTELQLERSALPAEIDSVELHAAGFATLAEQISTASLFEDKRNRRAPEELLDLVRARLGAGALHGLALGDDHRPEHG